MDDYKKYLASEVLSEGKLVTYRLLSRALKVDVHTAKQMLFEFHESQNIQKPNSVHATYLVYGEKHDGISNSEDVEMPSSPSGADAEPLPEPIHALTLTLVEGDKLKNALSSYRTVLSVQIYSLSPHPTKDLQLLSEANHTLSGHSSGTIPLGTSESHGGIINSNMRRKDRKGPRPALASNTTKSQSPPQMPFTGKSSAGSQLKNMASDSPQDPPRPSGEKSGSNGTKARGGGIMQSFAKAAASKPKPKQREESSPPAKNPATTAQSTAIVSGVADGEEGGHSEALSRPKASRDDVAERRAREEREAELKRMMEDDDEAEVEEIPNSPGEEPEEALQELEETEARGSGKHGGQGQGESQPSEVISSSGNGRRRGKRKVIKKRQVQDDEGYFVTVRETAWESFSEDETSQPKKATPPTTPSAAGAPKAKKPAPKGQGSIMSFFAKKS